MKRATRHAFTLIETLAVLILLAVLTTAVVVSLRGARDAARIEDVAERFIAFDRSARDAARKFDRRPSLRFDLNRGIVSRVDGERDAVALALPGGARVKRVLTRGAESGSGEVPVSFSTLGQSPSYAVLLAGGDGERWVAIAGLTGQATILSDERDTDHILSSIAPSRADAH